MVLNVGNGAVSDAHDDINIQGILCFGGIFAQLLLALDEVSADLAAFFVAFDHCQFFGCVQGEVVVLAVVSASAFSLLPHFGEQNKILVFREAILGDAKSNPCREIFACSEKGM